MIGPATNSCVEVGLNVKGLKAAGRLEAIPPGGMCNYKVRLTEVSQVDKELIGWLKLAFESAGYPAAVETNTPTQHCFMSLSLWENSLRLHIIEAFIRQLFFRETSIIYSSIIR